MAASSSRPSKSRSRFLNDEDSADSDFSLNDDSEAEISISEPTSFEKAPSRPTIAPPDPRKPTFRIQPSFEQQRLNCVRDHGAGRHFSKKEEVQRVQTQRQAGDVAPPKVNPINDIVNTIPGAYSIARFVKDTNRHFNNTTFPKLLKLAETVERGPTVKKMDKVLRSDFAPFKNAKRTFDNYVAGQLGRPVILRESSESRPVEPRPVARRVERLEPAAPQLPSIRDSESVERSPPAPDEYPGYEFSDEDDYGEIAAEEDDYGELVEDGDTDDDMLIPTVVKEEEPERFPTAEPVDPSSLGANAFRVFSIGDTFDSREHGKEVIVPHLGRKKVHWRHDKSDKARLYLQCAKDRKCAMKVRLAPIKAGLFEGRWRIRKLAQHSCELASVQWPFPDIVKPEKNRRRGRPPKVRKADLSLWAPDAGGAASAEEDEADEMDLDDLSDNAAVRAESRADSRSQSRAKEKSVQKKPKTRPAPKSKTTLLKTARNASSAKAMIEKLPRKQQHPSRRAVSGLHEEPESELVTFDPNSFMQPLPAGSSTLDLRVLALRCIRARRQIDSNSNQTDERERPSGPVLKRHVRQFEKNMQASVVFNL